MQPPTTDQTKIWEAYSNPQAIQPINESAMGRLFEQAAASVKRLARVNNLQLNHALFEYATQVFQAGFEAGTENQTSAMEPDEFEAANRREVNSMA